jgi:drug/metabolite transporter (DMT)-like permease
MSYFLRLSPRAVGIAAALITITIWTAFIVIARASSKGSLTSLDLAFVRILGAAAVLLPWGVYMVRKQQLPGWLGLSPLPFRTTALCGLFGGLLYALLAYAGFFYAPAAHASVLMPGSLPLWTALLAAVILKDRITPARALGLALIVGGGLLVGGSSLWQALSQAAAGGDVFSGVFRGDLLFISAAMCWSTYSVLVRRLALDAVQATIAITVFAALAFMPVYVALVALGYVSSGLLTAPWAELTFQVLMQGVGSVVISGIGFTKMIQHFGPVRSTMMTAVVPGLSALGAVIFLGEPLYWNLLVGLVLVTAGIAFGVRAAAQAPVNQALLNK